jgi:hypothetical protein
MAMSTSRMMSLLAERKLLHVRRQSPVYADNSRLPACRGF